MPEGWYSRDGLGYSCKKCDFKNPVRYMNVKGKMFNSKEPYLLTRWELIKEVFNARRARTKLESVD